MEAISGVRSRLAAVTSKDGTTGMKAAQHLTHLAEHLHHFSVPDRRGHGSSGPFGQHYGVESEAEEALIWATKAERVERSSCLRAGP